MTRKHRKQQWKDSTVEFTKDKFSVLRLFTKRRKVTVFLIISTQTEIMAFFRLCPLPVRSGNPLKLG